MSHLSQETMSTQKRRLTKALIKIDLGWGQGSHSESWMYPSFSRPALTCLFAHACFLPIGSDRGGAVGHCDSFCFYIWHQHNGVTRSVATPAFLKVNIWVSLVSCMETDGSISGYRSSMKGGEILYKDKFLSSVWLRPWRWWWCLYVRMFNFHIWQEVLIPLRDIHNYW